MPSYCGIIPRLSQNSYNQDKVVTLLSQYFQVLHNSCIYLVVKLSAVQMLKLRTRFLWRVGFKALLGLFRIARFVALACLNEKGFIRLHSRIILVELSRSWAKTYGVSYKKGATLSVKTIPILSNLYSV